MLPPKAAMGLLLTGLLPRRSKALPPLLGFNPLLAVLEVLFVLTGGRTEAIVGL